jgi:glycosyltransferase involved in cell wall biosynthesis
VNRKVVIALNTAWNIVNFRAGLIRALQTNGYEVVAVAPPDEYVPKLKKLGCKYLPLKMDNKGTHPGRDLVLLWSFFTLLRRERPAAFLGYTVKPNVYGSLAAHSLGIPVVNNIAGLGAVFIEDGWLARLVRLLYRLALARSACVFFQNEDDRRLFIDGGIVRAKLTQRIPGSGINPDHFTEVPPSPLSGRPFRFLLIARMLWDKGVGEYVEAARRIRCRLPNAEFGLLGFLDVQNPAAISREQIQAWMDERVVNYLGVSEDVKPHIAASDCVVLPSYREGLPRTLLEAMACGRPVITSDTTGCRDVVEDGVNGYLCRVRDAADLADKMERIMRLSPQERAEMGRRGRDKVRQDFDEQLVIDRYLSEIKRICALS